MINADNGIGCFAKNAYACTENTKRSSSIERKPIPAAEMTLWYSVDEATMLSLGSTMLRGIIPREVFQRWLW